MSILPSYTPPPPLLPSSSYPGNSFPSIDEITASVVRGSSTANVKDDSPCGAWHIKLEEIGNGFLIQVGLNSDRVYIKTLEELPAQIVGAIAADRILAEKK